ncbi:hypothetical protein O7627_27550 [Solwaraspora sp. WMMD1047]|uniref:hypothetical protein n=1 Tax=Solwaraspora sp. WMMD1047 TaxID=3016102 RepID=UPI002415B56A|nr:hypothetical protein [Solwaraspora sp. WMMD1047]MDG4833033.1 hypothetical protein [Solwaraspora sp. WMMD1047]
MSDVLRLPIADLRRALGLVLDEVERRHGAMVDLDADYYWELDRQAMYRFDDARRPGLTVGQLSDDLDSLRQLLDGGIEQQVVIWHDLAHLIGLLNRVVALDERRHE